MTNDVLSDHGLSNVFLFGHFANIAREAEFVCNIFEKFQRRFLHVISIKCFSSNVLEPDQGDKECKQTNKQCLFVNAGYLFLAAMQLVQSCGTTVVSSELPLSTHLLTSEGWTADMAAGLWIIMSGTGFDPTWLYPTRFETLRLSPSATLTTKSLHCAWQAVHACSRCCLCDQGLAYRS